MILKGLKQKFRQINWKRNFLFKKLKYFIKLKIISFLMFLFFKRKSKPNLKVLKKVLVMRNDCIGDMIVTTPFIRSLSKAGYEVFVSSRKTSLEIVNNNPYVSQTLLYNDRNFFELIKTIRLVRKHQFDLAIDVRFHRKLDLKHLLYCCFIRTSNLLSYNKSNMKPFNISLPYYESKAHVTNQLKYYLSYLNINFDSFDYDVFIDSQKQKMVDSFINQYVKPKSKFVVINPYGGSSYRCLSENQIKQLCYLFDNNYPEYKIIIIGQGNNFEKLSVKGSVKFQSPSITDVIPLIKKADLVITVDTSIVHLASAFSTKCISIYMEPLPVDLKNLKTCYSRQFSDYKYLQQDLFLDKNYIKRHCPNLEFQINKDIWSPNNKKGKQIVFYINSIDKIESDELITTINKYI